MTDVVEFVPDIELCSRLRWESQRGEIVAWLRAQGYTNKAAALAANAYIETKIYVETEIAAIEDVK